MKRRFTYLLTTLALLAFLSPTTAWGSVKLADMQQITQKTAPETMLATPDEGMTRGEVSITFSEQGYSNQEEITEVNFGGVTAVFAKGTNSNAPKYYTSGTAIRCYGGNTIEISANGNTITGISITFGTGDGSNAITSNVGTYDNGTWSGSASSVIFTIGGTTGNRRFAGLSVTYTGGDTPQPTEPAVTLQEYEISVPAAGEEDILTVQYQNIEEINASIQFYRYDEGEELIETTAAYYNEWFTASIDEDNNVSYLVVENEGEARTAYFKVYALVGEEYVYSNLITITQAVPDYATLPFNWAGGTSSDFTALNGVTASGLGSDYASSNFPYLIKFDNTGDYIQVKCDQQPGKVTIGVKMIGGATASSITIQGSADGETFTDIETLSISGAQNSVLTLETTNGFGANDRYVKMVFTKGSNVGVGSITIAQYVAPTAQNLTVTLGEHIPAIYVFDVADQNNPLIPDGAAGTAQVTSGTSILVSPEAADGYVLESLLVNNEDVTSQMDESGAYTFIMPDSDVTITATAARVYTIMFYVNGQEFADAQMTVVSGSALGTLPVPTANIPAGFTFVGWMESPANAYYNATTAPTMVDATTVPADDMILEAVFCISETAPGTWQLSTTAPEAGDQVVLAVNDEGTYYAFFADGNGASATEITVANNAITSTPTTVWTASDGQTTQSGTQYSGLGFARESVSGYLHFNNTSIKVAGTYGNGLFEFDNIQGTSTFTMYGFLNGRYLTYDEGFGVTTDVVNACPVYVFKYIAGSSSNYDYTTLVTNHATNTYIAQSNAETLYGIHYINGVVNAINDVTNNGKLVVKSGGELDMSFAALYNTVAANLIIEDGGQVSSMNEDGGKVFAGTMLKNITACDYNPSNNAGYYLIATPIEGFVPAVNNGFITTDYDLYAYDATKEDEWVNFKQTGNFSTLLGYQGYLYASGQNTTLRFEGLLNDQNTLNEGIGGQEILLNYEGGDDAMKDLTLVGNSGTAITTFMMYDDNYEQVTSFNYLTLNAAGDGFNTHGDEEMVDVNPLNAIFVQAPGEGYYMADSWGYAGGGGSTRNVNVKISRVNGDLLDNAVVSFGGSMMKKFYLTDNSTRVYFPISNQDYAVVRVQSEGDQPVNFKAKENGTYTLSVETKNIEMDYLHLIDNMTGADVDLLATPSYTFEAKTSDYASRFRLVFSANSINENIDGDSAFAYFNGSSWTISNMGEATLQVVDVMGRVLSSETLSGNAEVSINQPTGVYMLRLLNENNVRVQKIVVR